jgi:hypothetical protein
VQRAELGQEQGGGASIGAALEHITRHVPHAPPHTGQGCEPGGRHGHSDTDPGQSPERLVVARWRWGGCTGSRPELPEWGDHGATVPPWKTRLRPEREVAGEINEVVLRRQLGRA